VKHPRKIFSTVDLGKYKGNWNTEYDIKKEKRSIGVSAKGGYVVEACGTCNSEGDGNPGTVRSPTEIMDHPLFRIKRNEAGSSDLRILSVLGQQSGT